MKYLLIILLLLPGLAMGEAVPNRGDFDARVRIIDYNPLDVIKLTTFYGVSTHVEFGAGEDIRNVAVGDDLAWNIVPRGNHLFIKPKAKKADTNVTVVTDRHVYHFALMVQPRSLKDASAWRDPELIYGLTFRYPEEDTARKAELIRQGKIRERMGEAKNKLNMATKAGGGQGSHVTGDGTAGVGPDNYDYWVAGSTEISPTGARDDGRFTYLEFSNNRDMPAVYAVDETGKEALINTNVEGNTIIIHRVVPKLTLRKGGLVACIRNSAFDLDGGQDNTGGTIAPDVERVVKEAP